MKKTCSPHIAADCCSAAKLYATRCDLMDCICQDLVLHYRPEFAQTPCPFSRWYHPAISSSVTPFSICPQSFPASGTFTMNQLFPSGGQNIGASASVLPVNIQDWFPFIFTGLSSLSFKGLLRVLWKRKKKKVFCTTIRNHQFFRIKPNHQPSLWFDSHNCTWRLEKPQLWLYGPLSTKWCLCFLIQCLGLS